MTSERRTGQVQRHQQHFLKTCMKQKQKMKTEEKRPVQAWWQQQQQPTIPRRQRSLSCQDKEGPLEPVKNSLFRNSERKLKQFDVVKNWLLEKTKFFF